jgi:hypothetical protein
MTNATNRRGARMATTAGLALAVALGTTLIGQTDPNMYVNVSSRQDKAADKEHGEEYHLSLRDMLENRMFNGIKRAYPCIHYLDRSAAETMIGVQRMRDLLGGTGEGNLQTIATAVGASHYGNARVQVIGGTVLISGSLSTSGSATAIGRGQVTAPAGNDEAISAAMDKFVSQLVGSTGNDGPKCGRWQGEISATSGQHEKGKNPNGDPYSVDTDLKISCQIGKGNEAEPPCTLSYSYALAGKDASTNASAGGPARCNAGASIYQGKATIRVGACYADVVSNVSVAGQSASSKQGQSLGGWEVEFPVSADARQLSGSKQVDRSTTVTWSLSYK